MRKSDMQMPQAKLNNFDLISLAFKRGFTEREAMKQLSFMIVGVSCIIIGILLLIILNQAVWIQLYPYSPFVPIFAYGLAFFLLLLGLRFIVKGLRA